MRPSRRRYATLITCADWDRMSWTFTNPHRKSRRRWPLPAIAGNQRNWSLRRMPMRNPASICAIALAPALLAAALLATPVVAQVVDFGKYPNFKGQWDRVGPPNNWRQLAGPPPLTPEYQKILDQSIAE